MDEAIVMLQERGNRLDMLRVRALPVPPGRAGFHRRARVPSSSSSRTAMGSCAR